MTRLIATANHIDHSSIYAYRLFNVTYKLVHADSHRLLAKGSMQTVWWNQAYSKWVHADCGNHRGLKLRDQAIAKGSMQTDTTVSSLVR